MTKTITTAHLQKAYEELKEVWSRLIDEVDGKEVYTFGGDDLLDLSTKLDYALTVMRYDLKDRGICIPD